MLAKVLAECDRYVNKEVTVRDDTNPSAQSVQGNKIWRQSSRLARCLLVRCRACVRKVEHVPYAWAGWGSVGSCANAITLSSAAKTTVSPSERVSRLFLFCIT